jgi:rhodanese-related sulfurtransferase
MKVSIALVLLLVAVFAVSQEDSLLISIPQLEAMVERGEAYIVDVRDLGSYLSGHIPGAYAVPLSEIPDKYDELADVDATIVTYCACPAEETSLQAALFLSANGIENVRVLKGGIREWSKSRKVTRGPRRY